VTNPPRRAERIVISAVVAVTFFALTLLWLGANDARRGAGDFMYPWLAARALIDGREPYAAVPVAAPFGGQFLYPLPAALIASPFALMPPTIAGAAFVGLGFGWLTYVLLASGRWRLLALTAGPALFAVLAVQWSPLLTAAALSGPALALVIAKPTVGLALAAAVIPGAPRPGRLILLASAVAAVLLVIAFVLQPDWPVHWLNAVRRDPRLNQYQAPILTLYGAPSVLALLRWRRPEGRLLFMLSCVRQNGFLYDQLPLLLIPASAIQALILSGTSHLSHLVALWNPPADASVLALNARQFPFTVAAMYIPCVVMVLLRPNEGRMPVWVDRVVARWPAWLRGRSEALDDRARLA
jgi:hypothetical protein